MKTAMQKQKLYFNILTFEFPSEKQTFYFTKDGPVQDPEDSGGRFIRLCGKGRQQVDRRDCGHQENEEEVLRNKERPSKRCRGGYMGAVQGFS
mgnify:CR=1 FL=1